MTLIQAQNEITHISEDTIINMKNYLDSLNYISNLYNLLDVIKFTIDNKDVHFLPTFKGRYVSQELGLATSDEESEMKFFIIVSPLILEDSQFVNELTNDAKNLCEKIKKCDNKISFQLK